MYNFENIEKNVFEFAKEIDEAVLFYEEFANKFILNQNDTTIIEENYEEEKYDENLEEEKNEEYEFINVFSNQCAINLLNNDEELRINDGIPKSAHFCFEDESVLVCYINKGKKNEKKYYEGDFLPERINQYVNNVRYRIKNGWANKIGNIELQNWANEYMEKEQKNKRVRERERIERENYMNNGGSIENIGVDMNRIVLRNVEINRIKQTRYSRIGKNNKEKNGKACAVCIEEFQDDSHVMLLSCGHTLHYSCGCEVFSKTTNACIMCREKQSNGMKKGRVIYQKQEPLKSRYE